VIAPPRCDVEACLMCQAPVFTCELGECPEGFDHRAGSQLTSGAWVCSETCWESASTWPPKVDRRLIVHRGIALLAMVLVLTSFFAPVLEWRAALALAGTTAALIGIVFYLCELLPPAGRGGVRS
jgi:hypothetical protein